MQVKQKITVAPDNFLFEPTFTQIYLILFELKKKQTTQFSLSSSGFVALNRFGKKCKQVLYKLIYFLLSTVQKILRF